MQCEICGMSIWHDKSHHKVYHERILGLLSMYGQGLAPFDIGLADSCSAEDGWRFFYSVMWAPLDVLEDRWQSGTVKFEEWREISERARQGEPLWSVGDHFDLAGCYHRWILGLYWEPTPPHLDLGTRLWSAKKEDWPISLWDDVRVAFDKNKEFDLYSDPWKVPDDGYVRFRNYRAEAVWNIGYKQKIYSCRDEDFNVVAQALERFENEVP